MKDVPFNKESDLTRVGIEFDMDKAMLYAIESCKKCKGVGYFILETGSSSSTIRNDEPTNAYGMYCDCVRKSMRKYSV